MCALVAQSCLTLCNRMNCSPPGSSVHGTLQARILEWVAISFSHTVGRFFTIWATAREDQVKVIQSSQLFATHGLYSPWSSPGQNTGVASHSLLQGIFPTQGSNPGLLHCRQVPYQLREALGASCSENMIITQCVGFPRNSVSNDTACNAGDLGSISGWEKSPGGGNSNPLQYSHLENPMDREAWRAMGLEELNTT